MCVQLACNVCVCRLAEVQAQLAYAESQEEQKLALLKESDDILAARKEEAELIHRQVGGGNHFMYK